MRAALAQLTPVPRGIQENLARARALLSESSGADVLVLPELFLCGYELADADAVAIELDGPEVAELRTAAGAAGTALVVGVAERIANGVANSALLIDRRGGLAGVYRKTHLFGAENDAYTAGDELITVELDGYTVGPMICFDAEFPEVARTLTVRGAELLVTISANPVEFRLDHEVFITARALESGLPHVYCNRVGRQDEISFAGDSLAVDPEGRVLAAAGPDVECTITAELPEPGRRDARTRYTELMRPSLYRQPG
jgi:predicted amidohydrolase